MLLEILFHFAFFFNAQLKSKGQATKNGSYIERIPMSSVLNLSQLFPCPLCTAVNTASAHKVCESVLNLYGALIREDHP